MDRLVVPTILLVILAVTLAPAVAGGFGGVDPHDVGEEYLVHLGAAPLEGDNSQADIRAHAERTQESMITTLGAFDGITVERTFWIANVVLVTVDAQRVDPLSLVSLPGVTEVTPHATVSVERTTAPASIDPSAGSYTDGLDMMNVPEVWADFDTRGGGTTIAVLDTGVDPDHPDITVDHWQDFSDNPSASPVDYDWHGTHVAGTIVGGDASGTHIGVAPDASLAAGAVLTDCNATTCSGDTADLLAGMEWAVDLNVDVISLSLGYEGYAPELIEAVRNANAVGSTVVAAIGNEGEDASSSPGNVYDAIAVGAVGYDEDVPAFSSGEVIDTDEAWGSDAPADWPSDYLVPDIVAPGVNIESAEPGGGYRLASGTSMATPHVSGVVLLATAASGGSLSNVELYEALSQTAWKPAGAPSGQDTRYGFGIVDAYAAVEHVADRSAIEGTVTDDVTGSPVTGAAVTIEGDDTWTVQTDANGRYEQFGLPGDLTYTVHIEASGYASVSQSITVAEDETVTLDVPVRGDSVVRIDVRDRFGDAVREPAVTVESHRGSYPVERVDGEWVVTDIPGATSYDVQVEAEGYVTASSMVSVPERATTDIDVELAGDATIAVGLADAVTGTPIDEATVTLERGDATLNVGMTDEDGTLVINVPGTGEEFVLTISADGYDTKQTTVTPTSEANLARAVELDGDGSLSLELVDGFFEAPVENATVSVSSSAGSYPVEEASNGSYDVMNLPSDATYNVTVEAEGFEPRETEVAIDAADPTEVEVTLEGDSEVEIELRDATTDASIGDASLTLERGDGVATTFSPDERGSVNLTVPGARTYEIHAEAVGYEPQSTTATVAAGSNTTVGVDMPGAATVVVDVRDDHFGAPIESASIELSGSQGTYVGSPEGTEGVPNLGTYELRVDAEGYHTETLEVRIDQPGEKTVGVTLTGNATLVVMVNGSAGVPNASVDVTREDGASFTVDGHTGEDGRIEIAVPGTGDTYTVLAEASGYESNVTRSETVMSAEQVTVQMNLAEASSMPGFGLGVGIIAILAGMMLAMHLARRSGR